VDVFTTIQNAMLRESSYFLWESMKVGNGHEKNFEIVDKNSRAFSILIV
jgi:hypothetical protein